MFKIFNYNSRSFTIIAICFLAGLLYFNNKNIPKNKVVTNAAGARYNIEIDPNKSDSEKTLYEKSILYFFNDEITQNTKTNKFQNSLPKTNGNVPLNYQVKRGDKISLIYFPANVKTNFPPSPIEAIVGDGTLPYEIDQAVLGMNVGQQQEFNFKQIPYTIVILSVKDVYEPNK